MKVVSTSARAASGIPTTLRRELRDAATRAAVTLARETGRRPADVDAEMVRLFEAIVADVRANSAVRPPHTFARTTIEAFRTEVISSLVAPDSPRVSGASLLGVLAAMERLVSPPDISTAAAAEVLGERPTLDALTGMVEIAHDMRSPLSAILLLVEPIRRGQQGPVTPVQERQLGIIYGAALSLSSLANDILDAARGRHRVAGTPMRPFSIAATIQDACAVVRPIAEEKRLELRQSYPAVDGRIGNQAALHRVLLNLTSNALKYTEQGSVAVGATDLDGDRLEFCVQDTGGGIPEHVLASLFEGFRSTPAGVRFSSSGLGLAICRSLLAAMGSELSVTTSREAGTRFSFILALPQTPRENEP